MKLADMIRGGPFATVTLATLATVDPEPPQVSQLSQLSLSQVAPEPDSAAVSNAADAALDGDWEERAAIAEYDGKLCRDDAEAVADACPPAPPQPEPEDWVRWFEAEIDRRAFHMGLEAAQTRAMGVALNLWNLHHGSRGEPNCCAGCGEYLPASAAFTLADDAVIHDGDRFLQCLAAYGAKWRPAALAGLRRLGVGFDEWAL